MKNNKVMGLVMLSMGLGMLLVLILPGWGFAVAGFMAVMGFCMLSGGKK